MSNCVNMFLNVLARRAKRILANQNYLDKFYPHSFLTITVQMVAGYEAEIEKFARAWCNSDSNLICEINAVKEIFETENKDDMTWMAELLSNKHVEENLDRLIYRVSTAKR